MEATQSGKAEAAQGQVAGSKNKGTVDEEVLVVDQVRLNFMILALPLV